MNMKSKIILFLLTTLFFNFSYSTNSILKSEEPKNAVELTGVLKDRLQGVVTMVRRFENNQVSGGGYKFNSDNKVNDPSTICSNQKAIELSPPAEVVCGGTLIAGDLVLTAQHCLDNGLNIKSAPKPDTTEDALEEATDCTSMYSFVFDYTEGRTEFSPKEVYYCQEVVWQRNMNGTDVALIKLDRPVNKRIPIPINKLGGLQEGSAVTLIGPHFSQSLKSSTGLVNLASDQTISIESKIELKAEPTLDSKIESDASTQAPAIASTQTETINPVCSSSISGSPVLNSEGLLEGIYSSTVSTTLTSQASTTKLNPTTITSENNLLQAFPETKTTTESRGTFTPIKYFINEIAQYLPSETMKIIPAESIPIHSESIPVRAPTETSPSIEIKSAQPDSATKKRSDFKSYR